MFTLNCKGRLLSLNSPIVMGIINATPDSFFEGHLNSGVSSMIDLAGKQLNEGAAILDIGGQSTRPGSERISEQQELDRILPVVMGIKKAFPDAYLSIDTFYSKVAKAAVEAGADIVNDISAGDLDPNMINTVAELGVPFVCMHMKGTPQNMQQQALYTNMLQEILDYFIQKITACRLAGIRDCIVDPGFGFAKTIDQNFKLLHDLHAFNILDVPVLVGLSRKSSIYKTLKIEPKDALNGSTVLHTLALLQGAKILRVHDVKEAMECIKLIDAYKKAAS